MMVLGLNTAVAESKDSCNWQILMENSLIKNYQQTNPSLWASILMSSGKTSNQPIFHSSSQQSQQTCSMHLEGKWKETSESLLWLQVQRVYSETTRVFLKLRKWVQELNSRGFGATEIWIGFQNVNRFSFVVASLFTTLMTFWIKKKKIKQPCWQLKNCSPSLRHSWNKSCRNVHQESKFTGFKRRI